MRFSYAVAVDAKEKENVLKRDCNSNTLFKEMPRLI